MRILFIGLILFLVHLPAAGQPKQYVCTPCGSDCDREIFDRAGSCHSCGMALVEKSKASVENLTLEQLCERIAANPKVVLLDVRSPGEFKGSGSRNSFGHFKNAVNVNIDDLEDRVAELSKYKNEEVIVYCSHSRRSPRATYFLSTQGFTNVKNMAGGVSTFSGREKDECLKSSFVFH